MRLFAYLSSRLPDRNLWVVYRTMLVLSTAYGIALAVLPIVLEDRHIDHAVVGELASWFALGLVVFAAPSGAIIRRLSVRVVLPVCILGYGVMIAIIPLLSSYGALAVDRFVDGMFSMGAWMSAETLLLWRSNRENKALATSLSATFTMFGYVVARAWSAPNCSPSTPRSSRPRARRSTPSPSATSRCWWSATRPTPTPTSR